MKFPTPTEAESNWRKIIFSTDLREEKDWKPSNSFRFVYFSFNKNQIEPLLFKDAIEALFDKQVPILWENETRRFYHRATNNRRGKYFI